MDYNLATLKFKNTWLMVAYFACNESKKIYAKPFLSRREINYI